MKTQYKEQQASWIHQHNITIGSEVTVMRKVEPDEWIGWIESMDSTIGHTYTVVNPHYDFGIILQVDNILYFYPYFCLEPANKKVLHNEPILSLPLEEME